MKRTPKDRLTLLAYVADYAIERSLVEGSMYQYRQAAISLDRWANRPFFVDELGPEFANQWIESMQESSMSKATVSNRVRHLLVLWRSAHAKELCASGISGVRKVPRPRFIPAAWTAEQVRAIVNAARLAGGCHKTNGMMRSTYWNLVLRVGWDTGLRLGDLLSLTYSHIDGGVIGVLQSKTQRMHVCRLHESTLELLEQSGAADRERLVPWTASRELFRREFGFLVSVCGLTGSFKKIRKSAATNVELHHPGCGGTFLGHAQAYSTIARAHYLDPRIIGANQPLPEELSRANTGVTRLAPPKPYVAVSRCLDTYSYETVSSEGGAE